MTKLPSLELRFIGIPTIRHFNSMVPTFKMTEKDRSNHWALWRTPKTRLVTRFIYDHQRKLLTPGKIGLKIWLTIVLYLTKSHNINTDYWRNDWGDNSLYNITHSTSHEYTPLISVMLGCFPLNIKQKHPYMHTSKNVTARRIVRHTQLW